jgi:hypothetical protein
MENGEGLIADSCLQKGNDMPTRTRRRQRTLDNSMTKVFMTLSSSNSCAVLEVPFGSHSHKVSSNVGSFKLVALKMKLTPESLEEQDSRPSLLAGTSTHPTLH